MSELKFYNRKKKINKKIFKEIFLWIFDIFIVLVIAYVVVNFVGEKTEIIGESMAPVLEDGDVIVVNKMIYKLVKPGRNDIVVFSPKDSEDRHYYIKRVIGLPGETVQIIEGEVYINGEKLKENVPEKMLEPGIAANPLVLEEGEYFLLGDNRNNSEDSRFSDIGSVSLEDIKGKTWFCISPYKKIGLIH